MFHKPNIDKKDATIDSLIGKKIHILGDVIFEGGLRLDGQITGNLKAKDQQTATLVISEQARVMGEVHVTHLVLNGYVEGDVYISSLLELQPQAHIKGNLHYVMLEMHQGAIVEGRLIHTPSMSPKSAMNAVDAPAESMHTNLVFTQNESAPNMRSMHSTTNMPTPTFEQNALFIEADTSLLNTKDTHLSELELGGFEDGTHANASNDNPNNNTKNTIDMLQNKLAEGLSFFKNK